MTAAKIADPFDVGNLALTAEQIAELAPSQKKPTSESKRKARPQSAPSRTKFVMLPYEQVLVTAGRLRCAPLAVLVELAHQVFKTHRNPVALPNAALRDAGITRQAKTRALRELEKGGMVVVAWRGRRCPLVTVLWASADTLTRQVPGENDAPTCQSPATC